MTTNKKTDELPALDDTPENADELVGEEVEGDLGEDDA